MLMQGISTRCKYRACFKEMVAAVKHLLFAVVYIWGTPIATALIVAAPAAISPKYRDQLQKMLFG
jgi:hypothetical protein